MATKVFTGWREAKHRAGIEWLRTASDEARGDRARTVWRGRGRDLYQYNIDRLPDGGYVVYRHRGVQHVGTYDSLIDAVEAIGE